MKKIEESILQISKMFNEALYFKKVYQDAKNEIEVEFTNGVILKFVEGKKLKSNTNKKLQHFFNKYSENNFIFEIIEEIKGALNWLR